MSFVLSTNAVFSSEMVEVNKVQLDVRVNRSLDVELVCGFYLYCSQSITLLQVNGHMNKLRK